MDPKKLKEIKKLIKRQAKLANLKRLFKITFENEDIIICNSKNVYVPNNQFKEIPEEIKIAVKDLIKNWIDKTEANIDEDLKNLQTL